MERAQRRLLNLYPKRQIGNRMFQGDSSHLPLKLNPRGVIPPIFASSLLLLPITVRQFQPDPGPAWLSTVTALLGNGQPLYMLLYGALSSSSRSSTRRGFQPQRDGRPAEEAWRLRAGHPSGRADASIRLCAHPHHGCRRDLPGDRLSSSEA
jgi:hypothetical protein